MAKRLIHEEKYALKKLQSICFQATDEVLCRKFIAGHRVALAKNGILNITSNNEEWIGQTNIFCLMISNEENTPIAGLRIEHFSENRNMPIQDIADELTEKINAFVNNKIPDKNVAELCALWVHPDYRSNRMAIEITILGVAKSYALTINNLILIGAQHSEKISNHVGFVRCDDVMQDRIFLTYPNPEYKAVVRELCNIKKCINGIFSNQGMFPSEVEEAYERVRKYLIRKRGVTFVKSSDKLYSIKYNLN